MLTGEEGHCKWEMVSPQKGKEPGQWFWMEILGVGVAVLRRIEKSLAILLHFLLAAQGSEAIALSITKLNFNCNTFNANLSCYLS